MQLDRTRSYGIRTGNISVPVIFEQQQPNYYSLEEIHRRLKIVKYMTANTKIQRYISFHG